MGMEKNLTLGQLADTLGKSPEAMRKHFVRTAKRLPELFPDKAFSVNRPVSDEQAAILSARKRPAAAKAKKKVRVEQPAFSVVVTAPVPEPGPEAEPAAEIAREAVTAFDEKPKQSAMPTFHQVRRFAISVLLFSVVVMHGLLIWYDCTVLWGIPGQIGGGTIFIVVMAALLLASDSTLPRTSGNALAFIFFVDCAAWKVHFEVFKTPLVDNVVTGSLCAFICAASFIALYLFRDSKLD